MKTINPSLRPSLASQRTYLWTGAFVAGNLILPQLFHALGMGGTVYLPILFFTLLAVLRMGPACGILTAVASPLLANLLFGMPQGGMLGVVLVKSVVLACAAAAWIGRYGRLNVFSGLGVIASWELAGFAALSLLTGSPATAWNEILASWPAVGIQLTLILAVGSAGGKSQSS